MAADAGVFVLALRHHHGHGVPAQQAFDAALHGAVAGVWDLDIDDADGVHVGGVELHRQLCPIHLRAFVLLAQQVRGAVSPGLTGYLIQSLQPLRRLWGLQSSTLSFSLRCSGWLLLYEGIGVGVGHARRFAFSRYGHGISAASRQPALPVGSRPDLRPWPVPHLPPWMPSSEAKAAAVDGRYPIAHGPEVGGKLVAVVDVVFQVR